MCATALAGDWWAGWSRWKLIFLCKWQLQTAVISAIWRLAELRKVQFCTENRWQLIAMKTRFRIRPLMTDLQVLYTHKWQLISDYNSLFEFAYMCCFVSDYIILLSAICQFLLTRRSVSLLSCGLPLFSICYTPVLCWNGWTYDDG